MSFLNIIKHIIIKIGSAKEEQLQNVKLTANHMHYLTDKPHSHTLRTEILATEYLILKEVL